MSIDINAIQLADGLSQGLPNNPRERARTCGRRFDLSTEEKSLVLGPLPPQGRLEAAEVDGVDRLLRVHLMEQSDFERSRSVCRLGNVNRRFKWDRVENNLIVPAVISAATILIGPGIEYF